MRMVQTFWNGGGNPLIKSFGWKYAYALYKPKA